MIFITNSKEMLMALATKSAQNTASAVIEALKQKGFNIQKMTIQVPKEDNPEEFEEKEVNYTQDFIETLVDEIYKALNNPRLVFVDLAEAGGRNPVPVMAGPNPVMASRKSVLGSVKLNIT